MIKRKDENAILMQIITLGRNYLVNLIKRLSFFRTKLTGKRTILVIILLSAFALIALSYHFFRPNKTSPTPQIKIEKQTYLQQTQIKMPIIMYHYVEYVKDPGDFIRKSLDVNPKNFEEQLKSLKNNNYQTYFIKDIPEILSGQTEYSPQSIALTFDDGFEDFYTDAFPLLKKYNAKATVYVVFNFIGRNNYMNLNQLKEIEQSGLVEVGSHSLTHSNLASESAAIARKEIFESRKKLEEELGTEIKTFAYPYGSFSEGLVDLVKEASYSAAVSVKPGITQSENNLFHLLRIRPGIFGGKDMVKVLKETN